MKKLYLSLAILILFAVSILKPLHAYADTIIEPNKTTGNLTINKKDGEGDPLQGVTFKLYKIMNLTPGTQAGEYASYSAVPNYSSALSGVNPNALSGYTAADIEGKVDALMALTDTDSAAITMPVTDSSGTTTYANLGVGYYMVVEISAPDGFILAKPFFVAIPSTNNHTTGQAGTEWTYDVIIEPKNEELPLEKSIIKEIESDGTEILGSKDTASVGDDIEFIVDTMIPSYDEEFFKGTNSPTFKLTDTMSAGLTFEGDVDVYIVESDGTEVKVTPGPNTYAQTAEAGVDFIITFAKDFIYDNRGADIRLRYSAKLNANAILGTTGTGNVNNVELTYSNDPKDISKTGKKEDETRVYTYEIEVEKFAFVDGSEEYLSGAKFSLYTDAACTAPALKTLTTTGTGIIKFTGLKAGIYYLKEEQSPNGYRLLENPIKVEIRAEIGSDGDPTGAFTFYVGDVQVTAATGTFISKINAAGGIGTVAIENKTGFTLPMTGGMGVVIFLLIGVAGVALLSIRMFRKQKADRV